MKTTLLLKPFLLIATIVLVVSCGRRNKGDADSAKVDTPVGNSKSINIAKVVDAIPEIGLPFGPAPLTNYNFPEKWEDLRKTGKKLKRSDKEIDSVESFFYKLDSNKTHYLSIHRFKAENVDYGLDSLLEHKTQYLDSGYVYRLPNFGAYQCYYRYHHATADEAWIFNSGDHDVVYGECGDLVFINTKKKVAKILNVFNAGTVGEGVGIGRYFYIGGDKIIHIFQLDGEGSDELTLIKSDEIKVLDDGTLSIKRLKKASHY